MNSSDNDQKCLHNGHSFSGRPTVALTIGGSDPTGGAGIQADLKTFQQFGVHGLSVITAITVQNTRGVISTNPVSTKLVAEQLSALAKDIKIDAVKIGMLTSADVVEVVSDFVKDQQVPTVLDPILASSNGVSFLEEAALQTLLGRLCPLASVITPNIPEAANLTGTEIFSEATMQRAALRFLEVGANAVLIKGGHAIGGYVDDDESRDLFYGGAEFEWLSSPRCAKLVHGTGCVLSSAITSGLALGMPMREAIRMAKEFITEMIEQAAPLGAGQELFQFSSRDELKLSATFT